jgi:hypothetical protein
MEGPGVVAARMADSAEETLSEKCPAPHPVEGEKKFQPGLNLSLRANDGPGGMTLPS